MSIETDIRYYGIWYMAFKRIEEIIGDNMIPERNDAKSFMMPFNPVDELDANRINKSMFSVHRKFYVKNHIEAAKAISDYIMNTKYQDAIGVGLDLCMCMYDGTNDYYLQRTYWTVDDEYNEEDGYIVIDNIRDNTIRGGTIVVWVSPYFYLGNNILTHNHPVFLGKYNREVVKQVFKENTRIDINIEDIYDRSLNIEYEGSVLYKLIIDDIDTEIKRFLSSENGGYDPLLVAVDPPNPYGDNCFVFYYILNPLVNGNNPNLLYENNIFLSNLNPTEIIEYFDKLFLEKNGQRILEIVNNSNAFPSSRAMNDIGVKSYTTIVDGYTTTINISDHIITNIPLRWSSVFNAPFLDIIGIKDIQYNNVFRLLQYRHRNNGLTEIIARRENIDHTIPDDLYIE